jgi:hypothetical protein
MLPPRRGRVRANSDRSSCRGRTHHRRIPRSKVTGRQPIPMIRVDSGYVHVVACIALIVSTVPNLCTRGGSMLHTSPSLSRNRLSGRWLMPNVRLPWTLLWPRAGHGPAPSPSLYLAQLAFPSRSARECQRSGWTFRGGSKHRTGAIRGALPRWNRGVGRARMQPDRLIPVMTAHSAFTNDTAMKASRPHASGVPVHAAAWPASALVKLALAMFVEWREDEAAVVQTYAQWRAAPLPERSWRFAVYTAALDQEEKLGEGLRRIDQSVGPA